MALTKDKLATHLQTEIGMTKSETLDIVEKVFEIMKSTLANGDGFTHFGFWEIFCEGKERAEWQASTDGREIDGAGEKGGGV